jgi:hypothetical protein
VVEWALTLPRAYMLLGETSEALADHATARMAYRTLVERCGDLKPRAVLAERARARLKRIPAE